MSVPVDRQINIIQRAKYALRLLYGRAQHCHFTHSKLCKESAEIIYKGAAQKCPRHVRAEISGYRDAIHEDFQNDCIQFLYCVDGKFYSIRDENEHYPNCETLPREIWSTLNEGNGGFYYSDGSAAPYFVQGMKEE
jgi:hypothetical protein